jgi:hypothetical protein
MEKEGAITPKKHRHAPTRCIFIQLGIVPDCRDYG